MEHAQLRHTLVPFPLHFDDTGAFHLLTLLSIYNQNARNGRPRQASVDHSLYTPINEEAYKSVIQEDVPLVDAHTRRYF